MLVECFVPENVFSFFFFFFYDQDAGPRVWMTVVFFRRSRPRGTGVLPGWLQRGLHQGKVHSSIPPCPILEVQTESFLQALPFRDLWTRGRWERTRPSRSLHSWCDPSPLNTIDQTHIHTWTFFHCIVNVNFDLCLVVQLYPPVQEAVILHRTSTGMTAGIICARICYLPPCSLTQTHAHGWHICHIRHMTNLS